MFSFVSKKMDNFSHTDEIEKFYSEFPEYIGKVFVVNPDKHADITAFLEDNPEFENIINEYISTQRAQEHGIDLPDKDKINFTFKKKEAEKLYKKGSYCTTFFDLIDLLTKKPIADCGRTCLVILQKNNNKSSERLLPAFEEVAYGKDIDCSILKKHSIYHEFGHAIYGNRYPEKEIAHLKRQDKGQFAYETESVAECYSLIRLIQEYGIDNPTIEFIISQRTLDRLEYAESPYNFIPSLNEVVRLAKEGRLDNLSPHESIQLAEIITEANVLSPEDSKKIADRLDEAYLDLYIHKDIKRGAYKLISTISDIKEPVVLRDIQYIVQCLDDLTSNSPELQKHVKKIWQALKNNDIVKNADIGNPDFNAKSFRVRPRKSISDKIKGLFT